MDQGFWSTKLNTFNFGKRENSYRGPRMAQF